MSHRLPIPAVPLTRRRLLQGSGATAAAAFIGTLTALQTRNAQAAVGGKQNTSAVSPYGPIAPVNDLATALPLLQLPEGFAYTSYGWTRDPMSTSQPTPGLHDGMAVVRSRRIGRTTELTLVRNHERGLVPTPAEAINAPANYATGLINGIVTLTGAVTARIGANNVIRLPGQPGPPPFTGYAAGGTTNLIFRDGRWAGSVASLGGTLGNCAGGPTPWGSWLSCEETVLDFSLIGGKKHGYVYECAADPTQSIATPIVEMGRFVHEAVAVDPATGNVYLTEDNRNCSAFFRYVPTDAGGGLGSLQRGGRLQAARIKAVLTQAVPQSLANSNNTALLNPRIGDEYELEWVDIANPDADPRTVASQPGGVSLGVMAGPTIQALAAGCSRWSRGEGAVWELTLATMRLRALFVSGNQAAGNNPDNVTVSHAWRRGAMRRRRWVDRRLWHGLPPAGAEHLWRGLHLREEPLPAQRDADRRRRQAGGSRRLPRHRVRRRLLRPHRPGAVREHPDTRHHIRDHRPLGTRQLVKAQARRRGPGHAATRPGIESRRRVRQPTRPSPASINAYPAGSGTAEATVSEKRSPVFNPGCASVQSVAPGVVPKTLPGSRSKNSGPTNTSATVLLPDAVATVLPPKNRVTVPTVLKLPALSLKVICCRPVPTRLRTSALKAMDVGRSPASTRKLSVTGRVSFRSRSKETLPMSL